MIRAFDVDIDVKPPVDRKNYGIMAMVYNPTTERILPHAAGIYLSPIPVDAVTGFAAIDYKTADDLGYAKVDLLNNTSYAAFETKEEVLQYFNMPVDWSWFEDESTVSKLPHIANHVELVLKIRPRCMMDLADCLALIRPGKIHLIDEYLENKEAARKNLYRRPKQGVYFKKSHAVSYAAMIVCVVNRMKRPAGVVWSGL